MCKTGQINELKCLKTAKRMIMIKDEKSSLDLALSCQGKQRLGLTINYDGTTGPELVCKIGMIGECLRL